MTKLYKLFVSNIPWTVSAAELNEYFQQFGRVTSRVTFDTKTGLSRKFGFISVANKETVNKIVSIENHYLEGNYMRVNETNPTSKLLD